MREFIPSPLQPVAVLPSSRLPLRVGETETRPPAASNHALVTPLYLRATEELQGDIKGALAFSADGERLFFAAAGNHLRVLETRGGQLLYTLRGQVYLVSAMSYSPVGDWLATGTWSKTIGLWPPQSEGPPQTVEEHQGKISELAFHPGGKMLASASWDCTIKLWHIPSLSSLGELTSHQGRITAIGFNRDGSLLASGGEDRVLKLWWPQPAKSGLLHQPARPLRSLREPYKITALSFCPLDETRLVVGDESGRIVLYHLPLQHLQRWYGKFWPVEPINHFFGHEGRIKCLAISPDGRLLASGAEENHAMLWDMPSGWVRHVLPEHEQAVTALAFHPGGRILASLDRRQTLRLWDVRKGRLLRRIPSDSLK